ncbi:MAG: MTH938/NDUFAF3 family protein [Desulfobacterales bacterium]|nr:MTH938/NDUFAF3 family protein [Desulfobacterales bacterium]
MIDQYTTGSHMTVKGTTYRQDLKIIRSEVIGNWWRQQGHRLATDDISDILTARPKILVIGTGYAGNMAVPDAVRQTLESHQIKVIAQTTADATATFNRLVGEGKDVAGAFHLTC